MHLTLASCGCGCQNRLGIPCWGFGAPPILEPIRLVGLGPVHWGLTDLVLSPWPCLVSRSFSFGTGRQTLGPKEGYLLPPPKAGVLLSLLADVV